MVLEANKSDLERGCKGQGQTDTNHHHLAAAWRGPSMYIFVRENAIKYWCTVQGLTHNEVRVLSEKVQDQPEHHDDRQKRAEFSLPTWMMLNALEQMGFKVVSCGPYVTGNQKHDQREFVWTLHKSHDEWDSSSK